MSPSVRRYLVQASKGVMPICTGDATATSTSIGALPSCAIMHPAFSRCPRGRRTFFASSTDHTELMRTSEIHKLSESNSNIIQYVMTAQGMDKSMVKSVRQLHLARLTVDTNEKVLFGSKVVNRTLGAPVDVCGPLVEAALSDYPGAIALANLHGLNEWIVDPACPIVLSEVEKKLVDPIIDRNEWNEEGTDLWIRLATAFVEESTGSPEVALFRSKGASLDSILCQTDDSEYSNTCGGAMAKFSF